MLATDGLAVRLRRALDFCDRALDDLKREPPTAEGPPAYEAMVLVEAARTEVQAAIIHAERGSRSD